MFVQKNLLAPLRRSISKEMRRYGTVTGHVCAFHDFYTHMIATPGVVLLYPVYAIVEYLSNEFFSLKLPQDLCQGCRSTSNHHVKPVNPVDQW